MMYPMYSIRDRHTGFASPTVDFNDFTAKRNFSKAVCTGDGSMSFEPGDYDLYKIGEFDTDTGKLIPLLVPELVLAGIAAKGVQP